MTFLGRSMEPGRLRGPSCVARDIASAALACWDFYHAASAGFAALGAVAYAARPASSPFYTNDSVLSQLHSLPGMPQLGGWSQLWEFWNTVLQEPTTTLKVPELKQAARYFGLPVTGTKAELVLRVLGAFSLDGPTTAPARLLRALLLERSRRCDYWDGPDAVGLPRRVATAISCLARWPDTQQTALALQQAKAARGVAGLRAAILGAGFRSLSELQTAATVAWRATQVAAAERAAAAAAERAAAEAARRAQREAEVAARRAEREAAQAARRAERAAEKTAARRAQRAAEGAARLAEHNALQAQRAPEEQLRRAQQWTAQQGEANLALRFEQQQAVLLSGQPLPQASRVCGCGNISAPACMRACCLGCCCYLGAQGLGPHCARHKA